MSHGFSTPVAPVPQLSEPWPIPRGLLSMGAARRQPERSEAEASRLAGSWDFLGRRNIVGGGVKLKGA
jgi:hypothetical protein